jgi:hypothetical protein
MHTLFSKAELRVLTVILSIGLLIGSIPIGVIIVPGPTQPTFTLNVCQSPQMASGVTANPIARPAAGPPALLLCDHGKVPLRPPKIVVDLIITPESPPPKARA